MFTCFVVYFHKGFNNFCGMDFYSLFLIPFGRNSLYIGHVLSYVMTMYRKIEKTKNNYAYRRDINIANIFPLRCQRKEKEPVCW